MQPLKVFALHYYRRVPGKCRVNSTVYDSHGIDPLCITMGRFQANVRSIPQSKTVAEMSLPAFPWKDPRGTCNSLHRCHYAKCELFL